jgi:hypothetical protein
MLWAVFAAYALRGACAALYHALDDFDDVMEEERNHNEETPQKI